MSIFLKHIFRNIREKKGRTFLILMSLFGVALITSIGIGVALTAGEFINSVMESLGNYDFEVRSSTEEKLTSDRIGNVGYNFDYLGVPEYNYGYLKVKDEFKSTPLVGADLNSLVKMNFIDFGDKKLKLNDGEVVISKSFATENKLKENSQIEYYDENGGSHNLKVAIVTDTEAGLFQQGASIVTNVNTYLSIVGKEELEYDLFYVDYLGKEKIENIEEELYKKEADHGLIFTYNDMAEGGFDLLFAPYIKMGVVVVLFLFVVVYFSVNSVVKIIMNERIPVIGTFRSIGASKKNMNLILLAEMSVYGLIGGVLGSGLGTLFLKAVYKVMEFAFELGLALKFSSDSLSKNMFLVFVLSVIFIVLFQLSLSVFSIIHAGRKTIKECIFNKNETVHKYLKVKLYVGVMFFIIGIISLVFGNRLTFTHGILAIISLFISLALLLPDISKKVISYFNKKNNPVFDMAKNTVVNNQLQISTNIIVGVMLCISLLAFSVLNVSIISIKNKLNLVKSDLYFSTSFEPYNTEYEISSIDGIKDVVVLYSAQVKSLEIYDEIYFANNDASSLYYIYSDDYKALLENSNTINVDADLADKLSKNEIIVSNFLRDKYDFKVGDTVVLKSTYEDKHVKISNPINFKIVGFADTSVINNMSILVSEDFVDDLPALLYNESYFINLEDNADVKEIKKQIDKTLVETDSAFALTKDEYINKSKKSIKNNYKSIVMVLLIIIAVSLIGIINNQSVSFLQRKKEFAILYSTAMSRKQINKLMIFELFLSFIITSVVAFGLTTFILSLLNHIIEVLGFNLVLSFSFMGIFVVLFVVSIIMLCIYFVMRRKIRKMNIVEELKYE